MIKSRLTLTLLGACAVLAAAWPFRYQLYLHLPSEPVHRLVVKDGLYWLKGKVYSGRITETDVLKGGGLITITPVIDGVREGRSVTFDDGEPWPRPNGSPASSRAPPSGPHAGRDAFSRKPSTRTGVLTANAGFTAMTAPCSEVKPMRAACSTGW